MKALADWDRKELAEKIYDLIAKATIELRHKTSGKDMAVLAKSFAADLQIENSFRRLYLWDVEQAFRNGVRLDIEKQFLNIPTFLIFVPITMFMAKIGAKSVHKFDKRLIGKLFGIYLFIISCKLFYDYFSI